MTPTHPALRFVRPTALCAVVITGVILQAQGAPALSPAALPTQPTTTGAAPGTLDTLIAEVRQLRASVEESTRRQANLHMLSVALGARQSRLVDIANRLEATRRELAGATARTQASEGVMKMFQRETGNPASASLSAENADAESLFKTQIEAAKEQEEALRARETDLLNALQIEQAQWTDLVARLEQSVR